ncbi:MAG: hypothetical protein ACLU4K_11145 [Oscillospiraceae bacterium]
MTDMEKVELQCLMEEVYKTAKAFAYNHRHDTKGINATEILKLAILLDIKHKLNEIAESLDSLDSRL